MWENGWANMFGYTLAPRGGGASLWNHLTYGTFFFFKVVHPEGNIEAIDISLENASHVHVYKENVSYEVEILRMQH